VTSLADPASHPRNGMLWRPKPEVVQRDPPPLCLAVFKKWMRDSPDNVDSRAKLSPSRTSPLMRSIKTLPAAKAADSTFPGAISRAKSSAFRNGCRWKKLRQ
jgi:hypothetical protein